MTASSLANGQAVDQFYAMQPKTRLPEPLDNFDYLECTDCHHIIQLPNKEQTTWKISLMGLRPSILGVAKGVCPVCQELRKQFNQVIGDCFNPIDERE